MPEPTTSATDAAPAAVEDQPIRERVKELTSQVLQQGRVDPEAVREVASAVLGRTPGSTAVSGAKAREFFAEAVRQLDDALVKSASATHGALQQLASRGRTSPITISRRHWSACGSWKKTMWLSRIDLLRR
mgnify:CR=1 FL=1